MKSSIADSNVMDCSTADSSVAEGYKRMKVLFVASGNKMVGKVNSFVQSQYDSLVAEELDMLLFPVVGHGAWAHLRATWRLRQLIRHEHPDIVHAHYSIYGHVAWIACLGLCRRPKIFVSILGSFPTHNCKWRLVRFCIKHLWDSTLVKSERTRSQLDMDLPIIPNGVNIDIFHPMDQNKCRKQVGFDANKKYIVWCSNPDRPEKNWTLAQEAVEYVKCKMANGEYMEDVELVAVCNKTPMEVAEYMNAADCLLLTSDSEGSPNVIKEAMACNCPIVTTDVGDVCERLCGLDGCYIVEDNDCRFTDMSCAAQMIAAALQKALQVRQRTHGNQRIMADGLSIQNIADRIIDWYKVSLKLTHEAGCQ